MTRTQSRDWPDRAWRTNTRWCRTSNRHWRTRHNGEGAQWGTWQSDTIWQQFVLRLCGFILSATALTMTAAVWSHWMIDCIRFRPQLRLTTTNGWSIPVMAVFLLRCCVYVMHVLEVTGDRLWWKDTLLEKKTRAHTITHAHTFTQPKQNSCH